MEPVRSLYALSTWLLRVALLVLVYIIFFTTLRSPDVNHVPFWIAAAYALFSMLLFVGGFMKKSTLTVISAVILGLGCGYKIVMYYFFDQGGFIAIYFVLAALSLFFFANGNKQK
jgi:hypothetical protein